VIRTASEQAKQYNYFNFVLISVISNKKLFSKKAMLRHVWNAPYKIGELLMTIDKMTPELWNEMKQSLYNIENIRPGLFTDKYFRDTRKFAAALGKKINCAWSEKRLKLQHDIWAKEVVNIILEFEELRDLKIHQIYLDFAEFANIKIFKTNHELIDEGKRMSHCVGTYSRSVDSGESGIYTYGSGTLELGISYFKIDNSKQLYIKQYRGYDNKEVEKEEYNFISDKLKVFNETIIKTKNYFLHEQIEEFDELPF